jgi:hypothetical protein
MQLLISIANSNLMAEYHTVLTQQLRVNTIKIYKKQFICKMPSSLLKVQVSLDMSHNVYIYQNTDKICFQLDCICIVADKVVQRWAYVTYSHVIACACMYFDASRDASNV